MRRQLESWQVRKYQTQVTNDQASDAQPKSTTEGSRPRLAVIAGDGLSLEGNVERCVENVDLIATNESDGAVLQPSGQCSIDKQKHLLIGRTLQKSIDIYPLPLRNLNSSDLPSRSLQYQDEKRPSLRIMDQSETWESIPTRDVSIPRNTSCLCDTGQSSTCHIEPKRDQHGLAFAQTAETGLDNFELSADATNLVEAKAERHTEADLVKVGQTNELMSGTNFESHADNTFAACAGAPLPDVHTTELAASTLFCFGMVKDAFSLYTLVWQHWQNISPTYVTQEEETAIANCARAASTTKHTKRYYSMLKERRSMVQPKGRTSSVPHIERQAKIRTMLSERLGSELRHGAVVDWRVPTDRETEACPDNAMSNLFNALLPHESDLCGSLVRASILASPRTYLAWGSSVAGITVSPTVAEAGNGDLELDNILLHIVHNHLHGMSQAPGANRTSCPQPSDGSNDQQGLSMMITPADLIRWLGSALQEDCDFLMAQNLLDGQARADIRLFVHLWQKWVRMRDSSKPFIIEILLVMATLLLNPPTKLSSTPFDKSTPMQILFQARYHLQALWELDSLAFVEIFRQRHSEALTQMRDFASIGRSRRALRSLTARMLHENVPFFELTVDTCSVTNETAGDLLDISEQEVWTRLVAISKKERSRHTARMLFRPSEQLRVDDNSAFAGLATSLSDLDCGIAPSLHPSESSSYRRFANCGMSTRSLDSRYSGSSSLMRQIASVHEQFSSDLFSNVDMSASLHAMSISRPDATPNRNIRGPQVRVEECTPADEDVHMIDGHENLKTSMF